MKSPIFVLALGTTFISALATPTSASHSLPPPRLGTLKPESIEAEASAITTVSAVLVRARDKKNLGTLSQKIGDCPDCSRGISVRGLIGVRLQGNDPESLNVVRKASSWVNVHRCAQRVLNKGQTYSCTFDSRGEYYSLFLKMD